MCMLAIDYEKCVSVAWEVVRNPFLLLAFVWCVPARRKLVRSDIYWRRSTNACTFAEQLTQYKISSAKASSRSSRRRVSKKRKLVVNVTRPPGFTEMGFTVECPTAPKVGNWAVARPYELWENRWRLRRGPCTGFAKASSASGCILASKGRGHHATWNLQSQRW